MTMRPRLFPLVAVAAALLSLPEASRAESRCERLVRRLGQRLVSARCFESGDLTTRNECTTACSAETECTCTTPPNNSLPGLMPFAFTPVTDRAVIAPDAAHKTPIARAVPGLQLDAWMAGSDGSQARFLLRLPDDWNGRLVVAGASGTRSEFNGDFAWSDLVVQQGYAYASQNKGILNLELSTAADPLACRLNPLSPTFVHFYDDDPERPFTLWQETMVDAAVLARRGVQAHYGREPRFTYAVGTSNGGYQVRRAIELAPGIFDGGVDWEGTFVDPDQPNLLTDLPPAISAYPGYASSGFDPASAEAEAIRAAGYPPDLLGTTATGTTVSMWGLYWTQFWEVTQCQWQKALDPAYDTYGAGTGTYDYAARTAVTDVEDRLAAFATTGKIKRPLVTVAGTLDALLPIEHHARAYARKVAATPGEEVGKGDRPVPYRLYEVQNGNHIETYQLTFPQLELIEPHAQRAFGLLVAHVEEGAPLPPSQCIPRGGEIEQAPAQPGECAELLVP
jgi:hypothetical protein